jgi:transcriptional regulator of acetoin/glycerol metabolism
LKQFSLANARTTVVLAEHGLDARDVVRSAFLLRFLNPAARLKLEELIDEANFPEKSVASTNTTETTTKTTSVDQDRHLVPSSLRFVENADSNSMIEKIEVYLRADLPVLLLGVQGVGKNAVVDMALTRSGRARQLKRQKNNKNWIFV